MHIATINNKNNPNLSVASDVRIMTEDKIIKLVKINKEEKKYV